MTNKGVGEKAFRGFAILSLIGLVGLAGLIGFQALLEESDLLYFWQLEPIQTGEYAGSF